MFGGSFDLDTQGKELKTLEEKIAVPGFWDKPEKAKAVMENLKAVKSTIGSWDSLRKKLDDISELTELARSDGDEALETEQLTDLSRLQAELERYELRTYLHGGRDRGDAIITIHPGAGGTESQDWALMLHRMYLRWIERSGFSATIIDYQEGEEAGIKDSTIEVCGPYAYGFLKAEVGVHRLVRISPFDFNQRRHTSFASVFVYPQVDDIGEIEIKEEDLRIDTYRASGAGGQHVNKTESAVRITHGPSGIVVQCQAERSQHRNREVAMKVLKSRLYHKKLEAEKLETRKLEASKKEIAWGSQIRSYVLHPYTMVKDHRTNHEIGNAAGVLDGDLDGFIEAWLRSGTKE
jgi:peptide chain release factor 2